MDSQLLNQKISSLRIVSADSYMKGPILGLDPCYSEFRGSEIKQVPVIRIFGTDSIGIKTCMHVHGVFPYLYIPFNGSETIGDADRLSYQLASSLDKAINISLGQTNSSTQHVFKVLLVKGIPFYGYHQQDHQFLKIYLYNPTFVKRCANLLQNGAILGRIYQPYESHVPFILQFLIDFNLYGMSFLYVPTSVIKYRQNIADGTEIDETLTNIDKSQVLDKKFERMTTSKREIDITAAFILNRFQISFQANAEHANPGIAFIWNDERGRRQQMNDEAPPLVVPQEPSQSQLVCVPTESEIFHRTALDKKLEQIRLQKQQLTNSNSSKDTQNNSLDQSTDINISKCPDTHRKFNLKQFLQNSVYPAECGPQSQESHRNMLDASFLIDHVHMGTANNLRSNTNTTHNMINDSLNETQLFDSNDTVVDEELVLSLSQKPTLSNATLLNESLNQDEYDVLDIFQQLEEEEQQYNEKNFIENDSLLAPLSQHQEAMHVSQRQTQLLNLTQSAMSVAEMETSTMTAFAEEDSDDDLLNDFSMSILECVPEAGKEKPTLFTKVPQFDGGWDTPTKTTMTKEIVRKTNRTPTRREKKYLPLDITITKSPNVIDSNGNGMQMEQNSNPRVVIKKLNLDIVTSVRQSQKEIFSGNGIGCEPLSTILNCTYSISKSNDIQLNEKDVIFNRDINTGAKNQILSSEINSFTVTNGCQKSTSKMPLDVTSKISTVSNVEYMDVEVPLTNSSEITNVKISDVTKASESTELPLAKRQIEIPPALKHMLLSPASVKLIKYENIERDCIASLNRSKCRNTENSPESDTIPATPPRRYPKRIRKPSIRSGKHHEILGKSRRTAKPTEFDWLDTCREWSKCEVALRHDIQYNFNPKPGPSHIIQDDVVVKSNDLRKKAHKHRITPITSKAKKHKTSKESKESTLRIDEDDDDDNNVMIQSFYEEMFNFDSPSPAINTPKSTLSPKAAVISTDNDNISTPILSKFLECIVSEMPEPEPKPNTIDTCIIEPIEQPPNQSEINESFNSFEIPQVVNQTPFYSDPLDLTNATKKEIGQTMLQLNGVSINDCEDFKSQVGIVGLNGWRKLAISNMILTVKSNPKKKTAIQSTNHMREFLASEKIRNIEPAINPPSSVEATAWLKARKQKQKRLILNGNDSVECKLQNKTIIENDVTIVISDDDDEYEKPVLSQVLRTKAKIARLEECLNNEKTNGRSLRTENKQVNGQSTSNGINADESDSDVICIDDDYVKPIKQRKKSLREELSKVYNEVMLKNTEIDKKLEQSAFVNGLNLDDTISKMNSQNFSFGITGATLKNSFGFKMDLENFQCAKSNIEHNFLTILSVEIHIQTRPQFLPDPIMDEITCIFYSIHNDVPDDATLYLPQKSIGVFVNTNCHWTSDKIGMRTQITYVKTELELLMALVELIRKWDPDIFAGYEIEMASWGYILQRSQVIGLDLIPLISRVPTQKVAKFKPREDDAMHDGDGDRGEYETEFKLYGRILLDVWRLLRSEIALTSYSFENIMYHVLHRRYPLYSKQKLTQLWTHSVRKWIVIEYYLERVDGTLEILNQLDLIGRTCELAKLFGIQFYEVLSRGSQFRVESMMLRIAKPKNLIPVSPSVQQRAHMRAPEYLPLILEPHSRFYADPLIVLDFQSLYPSMIIAYNYCFSTCLGRVEHLGQSTPFEFGASQLRIPSKMLKKLMQKQLIHISPCGAAFVKSSVREGVLPRMLREILDARQMVKQSMKLHKNDKLLQRVLHSRQLGLKLMANVTYGYTAANFSGRMPCIEVGDSVVSKGRETLERAIKTVEVNTKWGCKVVYGDTDSLFVLVPGRTRADAFKIGAEIADVVTKDNPYPVKLKLEKVYQPSILQTKKRYVGYMYESNEQEKPVYEAKGIETVRRDGCPAVAKILEKTLRILFETCDVSAVKRYVCRQFTKILSGHANVQDLIFAKEFRGVNGYKPGACVPALTLTRTARLIDHRAEPRCGERVPYLVTNGPPGVPLIRLVRSPNEYLTNEGLKINAMYYITKAIIPPLNRCLLLIGADVNQWFADLPRKSQYLLSLETASKVMASTKFTNDANDFNHPPNATHKKSTISQYFSTTNCACDCGGHTQNGICNDCLKPERRQSSAFILNEKCLRLERKLHLCREICASCCGQSTDTKCLSLDCSVLFMLNRWERDSKQIDFYRQLLCEQF